MRSSQQEHKETSKVGQTSKKGLGKTNSDKKASAKADDQVEVNTENEKQNDDITQTKFDDDSPSQDPYLDLMKIMAASAVGISNQFKKKENSKPLKPSKDSELSKPTSQDTLHKKDRSIEQLGSTYPLTKENLLGLQKPLNQSQSRPELQRSKSAPQLGQNQQEKPKLKRRNSSPRL